MAVQECRGRETGSISSGHTPTLREDWSRKRALETPCHARIATSPQDTAGHVSGPAKPKVTWGTKFPADVRLPKPQRLMVQASRPCDLKRVIVNVISDFNACDSVTLDYVTKFITAWLKIKRRIWNLPYTTHNNTVYNLSSDIRLQLDKRIVTFIYNALNSSNCVSRSLLQSKVHCSGSTFASSYWQLSYKYNVCEEDWLSGISHLLGKVKMRFAEINKSCTYST